MRRRLDRYVFAEILGPLGLGFLVYTFILLLRFLFESAEMIIRRGLPISVVGELLLVTLPNIVVLTLPMSLLFGTLIAVGRLSSDSELIAMRACGISLLTLYRPILLLSALLAGLNTALMVYVLPWGNHALQQLRLDIMTKSVARQVEPRVFYQEWEGKVLYVFDIPPGQDRWLGVFLAEAIPAGENSQVTVADWGEVRVDEEGERIVLVLHEAVRHKLDLDSPTRYEMSRHKRLELVLENQFTSEQRAKVSVSKGLRELTLDELAEVVADATASSEQRNLARVEIHKKFSIPAATLVFGLFALPLGFNNRRGSKASGFALSVGVILVYYILLSNGEEAARYGRLSPWLAMWGPNILLAAAGLFLLLRRNRDKSLLLSRIDRWVREDLWSGILSLKRLGKQQQARRRERVKPARSGVVLQIPRLRILFPNLLDRYVIRMFAMVFALVAISGVSLFIIADLSETIDEILKNQVPRGVVIDYYKYSSLQMFYDIAPILVLVTTLTTFSLLSRSNEITACKALGMSLYRISLPALLAGLVIAALCVVLESGVLPAANEKVAQLKDQIRGRETVRTYRRADLQWLFGRRRYIYNYLHFDERQQSLQRLQVFDFGEAGGHRLQRRLFTEDARWIGSAWVFTKGWARTFDTAGERLDVTSFIQFDQPRIVHFPETPDYFASEIRPPELMRYGELKRYIEELKESGQPVPELRVELYNKIALPVVSLVMVLVALPFAFRLGKQGALYGVGLSIVLGIVFMAVFAFFTTLGQAAALPPAIAVWSPSMLFSLLSAYLFLGVRT